MMITATFGGGCCTAGTLTAGGSKIIGGVYLGAVTGAMDDEESSLVAADEAAFHEGMRRAGVADDKRREPSGWRLRR